MQFFDRSAIEPPNYLQASEAARARELLLQFFQHSLARQTQSRAPESSLRLDHPGILDDLRRLFRGKCAFCESVAELHGYRFRPPFEALPLRGEINQHLYYCWLADAWENLYPICVACHPANPHHFPVDGKRGPFPTVADVADYVERGDGSWRSYPLMELPLLLDPSEDPALHEHLRVDLSGWIEPISARGAETIPHFNLNRSELVAMRARRFAEYSDTFAIFLDGPDVHFRQMPQFEELEYGGAWYLYLRQQAADNFPDAVLNSPRDLLRLRLDTGIKRFFAPVYGTREAKGAAEAPFSPAGIELPVAEEPHAPLGQLKSVDIRNFKALEHVAFNLRTDAGDVDPLNEDGRALLILGENAAGKSSILEAVALGIASDAARRALREKPKRFILDPAFLTDDRPPGPSSALVTLVVDEAEPGRERRRRLKVTKRRFTARSEGDFRAAPVFAYGAFRQYLTKPPRTAPDAHIRSLFHSDFLLPNPENYLLGLPDRDFAEVVQALREILSIEGDFEVLERDGTRVCVASKVANSKGVERTSRTPLALVSSGFRAILAMVCDICRGLRESPDFHTLKQARAIVLIDEVEAHLHPRWKMQVMQGLRKAFPKVTFIATTHDPLCLRGMKDGEVMVLQRVSGESIEDTELPSFVETLVDLPNVSQLTIEQLLTSDLFQLHSTEAPELETEFARIGSLLAREAAGEALTGDEKAAITHFRDDVARAMPIGSSRAQTLIQEAVADLLARRRASTESQLRSLHEETKTAIREALEDI
ncbi:MAG TPA: AAA family ATPase [Allosphingosinicella sp.]|jgi:hypothetical protein|nr:AAA family ATPase [Allosphingosinicella sp.]